MNTLYRHRHRVNPQSRGPNTFHNRKFTHGASRVRFMCSNQAGLPYYMVCRLCHVSCSFERGGAKLISSITRILPCVPGERGRVVVSLSVEEDDIAEPLDLLLSAFLVLLLSRSVPLVLCSSDSIVALLVFGTFPTVPDVSAALVLVRESARPSCFTLLIAMFSTSHPFTTNTADRCTRRTKG